MPLYAVTISSPNETLIHLIRSGTARLARRLTHRSTGYRAERVCRAEQATVICSASEDGYWSNRDGWGGLETATVFTTHLPPLNLPDSIAGDARVVPLLDAWRAHGPRQAA